MIAPGRAAVGGKAKSVVVACAAQCGKTELLLDLIGERLDTRPAPILYVGPSQQFVREQFEPRIMQLFDDAATLKEKLAPVRVQSKTKKVIAGVPVRLAHGGSSTALKSDPAVLGLIDEYDEMLRNVRGQGDVRGLVLARGDTYADFVDVVTSTPSVGNVEIEVDEVSGLRFWKPADPDDIESAIWRLWQQGTRFHWTWACPHCGHRFVPRFECLVIPKGKSPAAAKREAYVLCPSGNGCVILDEHKADMNAGGVYVAPGQTVDSEGNVAGEPPDTSIYSFWVSGLCSPFVSFGDRAETYVTAIQSRDVDKIQTATNAGFGEVYVGGGGDALRVDEVTARRMPYSQDTLPLEAVRLTMAVDVQPDRLIYGIRAWAPGQTSWGGEFGEIMSDTAQQGAWNELDELIRAAHGGGLRLDRVFIDSGFRPGDPKALDENRIYEFCKTRAPLVYATKGFLQQSAPLIKSQLEVKPTGGKSKYGLDLVRLHTDYWKRQVFNFVRRDTDEPGAWFLPTEATDDQCAQIASEARKLSPVGKASWVRLRRDNHALDIEAMNCAAAFMLGVQRLRKETSPPRVPPEKARELAAITPPKPSGFAALSMLNSRGLK